MSSTAKDVEWSSILGQVPYFGVIGIGCFGEALVREFPYAVSRRSPKAVSIKIDR